LAQEERHVISLSVQVAELWALKTGLLDNIAPTEVSAFEQRLQALAREFAYLEPRIRSAATIDEELAHELRRWVEQAQAKH
jgi:F0F1-type ATP synthase alpha subunit